MKRFIHMLAMIVMAVSCIEDKSQYDYLDTNKVSFDNKLGSYICTAKEEVELVAPVIFSKELKNEEEINEKFHIEWYVNESLVAEGYRIKHTFDKSGGYSMVIKVTNRETGEIYLSETSVVEAKNAIGWGWMFLSSREGNSSLSFIHPVKYTTTHNLENDIPDGLGTGPKRLFYYFVKGSTGSNFTGLPKVIVNQKSGTVTLDGNTLQKDKWMKDEFSGTLPEEDFTMTAFSWKLTYYLIATAQGNVYMKYVHANNSMIPYHGTYSNMPYAFSSSTYVGYMHGFNNVSRYTYVANYSTSIIFDSQNPRFIAIIAGDSRNDYIPYEIELSHYDETKVFDASVPPVNDLGQGTRCLAFGAYERDNYIEYDTDGETILSQSLYPRYVSLLDLNGTKNYKIYQFGVSPMNAGNHNIVEHSMEDFNGVLTDESIIRFSTDFSTNPYFYYTDGGNKLYVYGMQQKTSKLLYEASAKITRMCSSPLYGEFEGYGGNSKEGNWKLAVAQENGDVAILDVTTKTILKVMEGASPKVELAEMSGFGDVKDIVWATNVETEF